jgi:vacuolar-type H+-ATPase subunit I/STV1
MAITKMRKIRIIAPRKEVETVLREIVLLSCIEISDSEELLRDPELASLVTQETFELDSHSAYPVRIPMLATGSTVMFSGWLPSGDEPALTQVLSQYICSWETEDLAPEELDSAPVILKCPKFFGKLRLRGRKPFNPLTMLDMMPLAGAHPPDEETGGAGEESSQL